MTPIDPHPASPSPAGAGPAEETDRRRAVMTLAAAARFDELAPVAAIAPAGVTDLRPPEVGLVMVRGRIGGDGRPFNLGEATVTRAAVRLPDGRTGLAHLLGRDRRRARAAALLDALWADERLRPRLETEVLAPIRARLAEEERRLTRATAATRVDFLTLVRGDD